MYARVNEYAACWFSLVESVDPKCLYIDAADFDLEMPAQYVQLYGSAPCVLGLYPPAIFIWFLVKHHRTVHVLVRLYLLRDDGAKLRHVVHCAEKGATECAEEAAVIVRHNAKKERRSVNGEREFGGFKGGGGSFAG